MRYIPIFMKGNEHNKQGPGGMYCFIFQFSVEKQPKSFDKNCETKNAFPLS